MKKSKTLKLLISMIFLFSIVFNATTLSASVKKFTLKVGEKKQLVVYGTSGKKVKWKSSKKKIATVNKKGIVKGKKKGKTTITAKYGSKQTKFKITVKKANNNQSSATSTYTTANNSLTTVSNSELAAGLLIDAQIMQNHTILLTVTNTNSQMIPHYTINYMFKNSNGIAIETGNEYGYVINAYQTHHISIYGYSSKINQIDLSQSIISATVDTGYNYIDVTSVVTITPNQTLNNVDLALTCYNSDLDSVFVDATVLYYDNNGAIIGSEDISFYPQSGETVIKETYNAPSEFNSDYDEIPLYSSYSIVYHAYKYNY